MKTLAYLMIFGLFAGAPVVHAQDDASPEAAEQTSAEDSSADDSKEDEKALKNEANRYWQTQMLRKKKAVGFLKKVKDKKSGKKAAKQLSKLYNLDGKGKKDAPKPEDSEYMDAAEKRFSTHIEKLNERIEEEQERINEIGNSSTGYSGGNSEPVMSDDLRKGIEAALK